MNFVAFSPHFPPNFYPFWVNLRKLGVNVLGLADSPYEDLDKQLKDALTEYYRVHNALNHDELVRALGYFTHRYGKIDRLESHNEFWLESDARLRTDFNIPGFHTEHMPKIKRKSLMKNLFIQCGIPAAKGKVLHTLQETKKWAGEISYPIVAKPDVGVGANKTFLISNDSELAIFFENKPPIDYFFEEYIAGEIVTFDGLVDQDGKIVFKSSMHYSEGVMESVNNASDIWYYIDRDIPQDLEDYGRRIIEAYSLKERFFHFEFFRGQNDQVIALEVNMRPPGGMTTDMWDFANDIDIYREYANIVVNNRFDAEITRPYYCGYMSRRLNKSYKHSIDEILHTFPGQVIHHEYISGIFAAALGDFGFLVRTPYFEEMEEIAIWIKEN